MKESFVGKSVESIEKCGDLGIALGTMHFGSLIGMRKAHELLDMFYELGGRVIDTANSYASWVPGFAGGESETVIGSWFKARKNRNDVRVCSKVGFEHAESARGLRAEQVVKGCEGSLQRLGIERIDLYFAHFDDQQVELEETLGAFDTLVRSGKIENVGASNIGTRRFREALTFSSRCGLVRYSALQQMFSYLRPKPVSDMAPQVFLDADMIDLCAAEDVPVMVYGALLKGAYCGRGMFRDVVSCPVNRGRIEVLTKIADECSATINQVVLAWVARQGVTPIVGVSSLPQLIECAGTSRVELSTIQLARLGAVNRLVKHGGSLG